MCWKISHCLIWQVWPFCLGCQPALCSCNLISCLYQTQVAMTAKLEIYNITCTIFLAWYSLTGKDFVFDVELGFFKSVNFRKIHTWDQRRPQTSKNGRCWPDVNLWSSPICIQMKGRQLGMEFEFFKYYCDLSWYSASCFSSNCFIRLGKL